MPPDIKNDDSSADMAVQEGEDTTLTCKATGNPPPRIIWRREDGEMILMRNPATRELIKSKCKHSSPSVTLNLKQELVPKDKKEYEQDENVMQLPRKLMTLLDSRSYCHSVFI